MRVKLNHLEDFESPERGRADTMLSTMVARINTRLARYWWCDICQGCIFWELPCLDVWIVMKISWFQYRFLLYVGYKILNCIFSTVQVHEGQLETLKQISETPHPVIFVPLHKSCIDYILVSFILLSRGMHVPMVAAGENLNIAVIGWVTTIVTISTICRVTKKKLHF